MKVLFLAFVFLYAQHAAAGKPCERLAELVGETIDWITNDFRIGQMSNWRMSGDFETARDEILRLSGIDFFSESDRATTSCRAFGFKKLREVYDFMNETPLSKLGIPYSQVCKAYKQLSDVNAYDLNFAKTMRNMVKALATWMHRSDFPLSFPVHGDHQENVDALKELQGMVTLSYAHEMRDVLTSLLPIMPRLPEEQPYKNQTSVDNVVGWMESSNSIFAYASMIHDNVDKGFEVGELKSSRDLLMLTRDNYDKMDWYVEAVDIIQQSNILKLDTSDCPERDY